MKTEYLITFDAKDQICTNVEKLKGLLSSHVDISFPRSNTIAFGHKEFSYQLAQGVLNDGSFYYDLTFECSEPANSEFFAGLLREVRKICTNSSRRNVIILHDGIGEGHCLEGYPIIYRTESIMRKLISKFMAISIGYDWSDASTPKEVLDSVRVSGKQEKANLLHEVDFIQLSNFLFKQYAKADSKRFFDTLKERDDTDHVAVCDLKQYAPFTNWEKYFSQRVQCDSEYLQAKWERLYLLRCKIAHCKGLSLDELEELRCISDDLCEKIQAALNSIGDLHIEDSDREELAENFSSIANQNVSLFLHKYNLLVARVRHACECSSSDEDIYNKHQTNKTNIRMQSKYLCNAKGLIDYETTTLINNAQAFRNRAVHQMGIVEFSEAEIIEAIQQIDPLLELFDSFADEYLVSLRGIDLRKERNSGLEDEP
jgi:hypothetical protein